MAVAFVLLTCTTTLVAAFRGSGHEGIRAFAESIVLLFGTIAAMFGVRSTFHGLGLGHWPPRDGVYVRQFRERRAEWIAVRDRVLREAKTAAAHATRNDESPHRDARFAYHYASDGRARELGAELTAVADDATWIRFILYEGEHDRTPIQEKGLLYVDPAVAASSDTHWIDSHAVEDLGDGWYVYEE